ncbi:MAG: tetratricopeptide repeat protein [Leptolyngbyaceae cyanobacterium bins.59]|nr:tetratricopeptide repeat protein [Leptolyngbyaceae cyanobacterium bins.59]
MGSINCLLPMVGVFGILLSGMPPALTQGSAPVSVAAPFTAIEFYNQGLEKRYQGDYRGAWQDFNQAIRLQPTFAAAYNNRGVIRLELGDVEGALADYERAIGLIQNYSVAYMNRGNIRRMQGDRQGAVTDISRAIQLNSNWGEGSLEAAHYLRGQIRLELGDRRGASQDFRRARQLGFEEVDDYLQLQLQNAVALRNWEQAMLLVDVMVEVFPTQAGELRAYRARLQRM